MIQGGLATNPTFAELSDTTIGAGQNANFATGALRGLQIACNDLGFTAALTTWAGTTGLRDCLARLAGKAADEQVSNSNKRAFAALLRTGMATISDPVPIGQVTLNANIDFALNTGRYPNPLFAHADITGFTSQFVLSVGGLDADGVAPLTINQADVSYTSAVLTDPVTSESYRVCLKQFGNAGGKLCCNPAGCTAALGSPNYTFNQDHDSSGNNPGYLTGEVGPADPTCSQVISDIRFAGAPLPGFFPPCLEAHARPGGCNTFQLGSTDPFAHYPRCVGGTRNKLACDPSGPLADECPSGGTACKSQSVLGSPLTASPCNSAAVFTTTGGTFDNGAATILTLIEFLVHQLSGPGFSDAVNYNSDLTCNNGAGDGKPDSYGCDGIPCDADDGIPYYVSVVPFILTTGAASSTIFDSNMVQSASCPTFPGKIFSQNAGFAPLGYCLSDPSTGVVPANACANLSQNKGTGYELVGTFPQIDTAVYGDGAISMRLKIQ